MISLTLPYPPSVNHYWRHVGAKVLVSQAGREYRDKIRVLVAYLRVERMDGPLSMEIEIHPPDNRRRDIDNILKATLDALAHAGVYEDDNQIVRLVVKKHEHKPGDKGFLKIRIEEQ